MEPGKTVAKAARVLEVINKYRKNPSGVAVENKKTDSRLRYIRMSTSNFQWRHDGLRWRIKLMQNTPITSLFYCRARDGHDNCIFLGN